MQQMVLNGGRVANAELCLLTPCAVLCRVVAKNSVTGKQSSPVTVIPSSVKAAAAPPTQGVKPL